MNRMNLNEHELPCRKCQGQFLAIFLFAAFSLAPPVLAQTGESPSRGKETQDGSPRLPEVIKNGEAEYKQAVRFEKGDGVPQNYDEAAKWHKKAAEKGHALSQVNLGLYYQVGIGVSQSNQEAAKWYRKAAEQGNAAAQWSLGSCYENGDGVSKNSEEAAKWYRKAAEQGNEAAQYALGLSYGTGEGVPINYEEAYFWDLLSLSRIYSDGKARTCKMIESKLKPTQIVEVQRRVAAFIPKQAAVPMK